MTKTDTLISKVCLSLLNTWDGAPSEMWQPNKSTILSALVSIQAMILGAPLPWLNEPGYENQGETPRALQYNLETQCKTVRYAMIYWLKKISTKDSIWKGVSEMYWKCHGQQVLNTVKEWTEGNSGLLNYNPRAIPYNPHHPHHPPKKSKGKAKETAPEVSGENLLDMCVFLFSLHHFGKAQIFRPRILQINISQIVAPLRTGSPRVEYQHQQQSQAQSPISSQFRRS
jgi:hypothetical protein